jgi:YVTN family beta-propeller protein
MITLFTFMFGSLGVRYKLATFVWILLVLLALLAIVRPWRRWPPLSTRPRAAGVFVLLAAGVPLLLIGSLKLISVAYQGSPTQALSAPLAANSAVNEDVARSLLFASVWGANYISVVDLADFREIKRIPANADGPATEYATPDNHKLYVENGGYRSNTVSVLNPATLTLDRQFAISGNIGDRATRIQRDGAFYYVPQATVATVTIPAFVATMTLERH